MVSLAEVANIEALSGIPQGFLPIRYIGLPLSSKKLSMLNCEPLLQSIRKRINCWTSNYLSFAGRQVLINRVIAGITNFWCSAFVLPKECIRKIDSMCNAFLWKGTLQGNYSAKVFWETVTLPKDEGGLGIKNLNTWNALLSAFGCFGSKRNLYGSLGYIKMLSKTSQSGN